MDRVTFLWWRGAFPSSLEIKLTLSTWQTSLKTHLKSSAHYNQDVMGTLCSSPLSLQKVFPSSLKGRKWSPVSTLKAVDETLTFWKEGIWMTIFNLYIWILVAWIPPRRTNLEKHKYMDSHLVRKIRPRRSFDSVYEIKGNNNWN